MVDCENVGRSRNISMNLSPLQFMVKSIRMQDQFCHKSLGAIIHENSLKSKTRHEGFDRSFEHIRKLGLRYIGPIDGHDIDSMVRFFEFAKESDEPIVLHLITEKGKGYPEAQKEPEKWHGAGPFDSKTGRSIGSSESKPKKFQDVFGETLCELAHRNDSIIGITAAMPSGTGTDKLGQNFPDRFFDVGIAEEHAVLMAAGMASKGFIPIC